MKRHTTEKGELTLRNITGIEFRKGEGKTQNPKQLVLSLLLIFCPEDSDIPKTPVMRSQNSFLRI